MVLGLDLDGVLIDWHDAVYTYYQYEMGYNGTYTEFWLNFINNLPKEKQDYIISIPFLYESKIPPQCVIDFLDYSAKRADIYYLTSRPLELERITRKYFKKYNFPFQDNLIMTSDKANACRLYGVTHFLDDHAHYVESVAKIADAYLMAKIWNKEYQDKLNTVHNLKEFKNAIFGTTD